MDFQPALTNIMAKLNNLLIISDNVNKSLDRIIDRKVVDKLDSTIPPIFTPAVKDSSDISKELQDKSPLICDTQPEIEYDSEEFTYHPDLNSNEKLDDDLIESSTLIFSEVTM